MEENERRRLRIAREEAREAWFGEHEVGEDGYKEACLEELADQREVISSIRSDGTTPLVYRTHLQGLDINGIDLRRDLVATIIELKRQNQEPCYKKLVKKIQKLIHQAMYGK